VTASLASVARVQAKVPSSRSAIAPGRAALAQQKVSHRSRARFQVNANLQLGYQLFADEFVEECKNEFPDKGIADVEEGMCLFGLHGYTILDVRSKAELDFVGNYPREVPRDLKNFVAIPIINAYRKYNSETQQKDYVQESNPDFMSQVAKAFPDKEAKIVISCSDGRNRAIQALEALDNAGYVNIVGLKGGYNMWNRMWDSKLRRRDLPGTFKEEYGHKADGCGVHATGATFENQDAFQKPDVKDTTQWIEWKGAGIPA